MPLDPAPAVGAARRIGLFGGSFDPVHLAHRQLADAALAQLALDEVRWVVAGQPWQKARQWASGADRATMVGLAIVDDARHRLESCELDRAGPSYTLDTVMALQARHAADDVPPADWFLILGQDQYANFTTWHGWRALLERVTLAVAARDAEAVRAPAELAATPHRRVTLQMPPSPISATAIRQDLADRTGHAVPASTARMLAATVAAYIEGRGLYHRPPAASSAPPPGNPS